MQAHESLQRESAPLRLARPEQVWELLAATVTSGDVEDCPLASAVGRVLAREVASEFDYPPFDRAVMDGFAVRAADCQAPGAVLAAGGLARAGGPPGPGAATPLAAGTCIQINTGAPLPPGADAVIMIEKAHRQADGRVRFDEAARPGQFIERRGSIARGGQPIAAAGLRIGPGGIAALAAAGARAVHSYRRPRVALFSTGDEIVAAGGELGPGQIFDSNTVCLAALIGACGGQVISTGRCPDEPDALRAALRPALQADVLCVTGGMSKGTHDLVPAVLESLGARWIVESLDLKPGKPTRIGRFDRAEIAPGWVMGLPGNPVSCAVCFLLFGRAIIEGLQGIPVRKPRLLTGRSMAELPASGSRPFFQPARWTVQDDGEIGVQPLTWRGSGDPFGLCAATALIYRPQDSPPLRCGEPAKVLPLYEAQ